MSLYFLLVENAAHGFSAPHAIARTPPYRGAGDCLGCGAHCARLNPVLPRDGVSLAIIEAWQRDGSAQVGYGVCGRCRRLELRARTRALVALTRAANRAALRLPSGRPASLGLPEGSS